MKKQKNSLFPILFNGKQYYEKDCDGIFLCFYTCRESLNDLNGVYMSEDMWVYPDGSMDEF